MARLNITPHSKLFSKLGETIFIALDKIKEQLHALINETNNEILLEDLLMEAETRINSKEHFIAEGISKEDYEELISLDK